MNEAAVMTQRRPLTPLQAAGARAARSATAASLGCLLLLAAGCGPGDPARVIPPIFAGISGGSGVAAMNGGGAGVAGPPPVGTAGGHPIGAAGATEPVATAGAGSVGPPPTTAGRMAVPMAGTGGVAPTTPDGGMPAFDAGTEPNRNQVRAGGICARFAALQCAAEVHCCAAPAKAFDACKTQVTMSCTTTAYLDEIAMNNLSGFSTTQTEAAFNRLEEFAAACDPSVAAWAAQPDGLRAMFQGTVAPMGMCKPSGLPSVANYAASLASCTQLPTHACLFTGDGPATPPQTATCAARSDAGATCFVDVNCKDGLYCANPQMKYSQGTCTVLKPTGATCTLDTECASFTCRSAACVVPTEQTAYCVSK